MVVDLRYADSQASKLDFLESGLGIGFGIEHALLEVCIDGDHVTRLCFVNGNGKHRRVIGHAVGVVDLAEVRGTSSIKRIRDALGKLIRPLSTFERVSCPRQDLVHVGVAEDHLIAFCKELACVSASHTTRIVRPRRLNASGSRDAS